MHSKIIPYIIFLFLFGGSSLRVHSQSNEYLMIANSAKTLETNNSIALTKEEKIYLRNLGSVTMCVDPDWEPFEKINIDGEYVGIASDLIRLISERLGIKLKLIKTENWDKSLIASQNAECQILALLNQTPERDNWLIFTEPYFIDYNVFITREEHEFIPDPATLVNETIVFPSGTGMSELIANQYPNLKIVYTESEAKALEMVSERKADMTMRSLIMSAYIIKKEGLFNLKIAGKLPDFTNKLRIGVLKDMPMLRDIFNKGIKSITNQEVNVIINKHVSIKVEAETNYGPLYISFSIFSFIVIIGLVWNYQLKKYNTKLNIHQTELEKVNEELAYTSTILEESLYERNRLVDTLENLNKQKDKFFSIVAHDLKSPFQGLIGFSQLLRKDYSSLTEEEIKSYIESIEELSQGSYKLLENLLDWSRLQTGHLTFTPENFNLLSEINPILSIVKQSANNKNIEFSYSIDESLSISADKNMLSTIIRNLLFNSIKFTNSGGEIRLSVNQIEDKFHFSIVDSGIGIDKNNTEKLFIIEKSISTEGTSKEKGTGLGLLLCKEMVEKHNGSISVESEIGKGSTFKFII